MTIRRAGAAVLVVLTMATPALAGAELSGRQKLRERYQSKNIMLNAGSPSWSDGRSMPVVGGNAEGMHRLQNAGQMMNAPVQESADESFRGDRDQKPATSPPQAAMMMRPMAVQYAIYQTEYQADIEEDIAFVKQQVQLEVFSKTGSTSIPLVSADVGLKDVTLNQKPSVITRMGDRYYLVVNKPGRYHLAMEFFAKVTREREHGPGSFSFQVLPSPISILDVQIAEPDMDVFVDPSMKIEKETADGKTLATVVLPYTERVTIRWNKAISKVDIPTVKLEPKLYVDVQTLLSIGEGVAHGASTLRYSILQSEVSELKVVVPDDVTMLEVHGADVRDWKMLTQDGKQVLDVYLSRAVKGSYDLQLVYEKAIGEGSVTAQLPELIVLGVERQRGLTGVQARTNVEISFGKLANATQIDVKELPQDLWGQASFPILLAYKYLNHPVAVDIEVVKHAEISVLVAAIDSAHYVTLLTEEGKVLTQVTLQMRNNVKQFVRLALPTGATFLSCFVSGRPVKPAQDANGKVLIPLQKSESLGESIAQFPVEIMYLTQQDKFQTVGRSTMHLPQLDIPTSQLYWSVYVPEEFNYWLFRGDVKRIETMVMPSVMTKVARKVANLEAQVASQSSYGYKDQLRMEEKIVNDARTTGVLPVRMDMPTAGSVFRFTKLLITDESPWLTFTYSRNMSEARGVLSWVVFFLLFFVAVGLARKEAAGHALSAIAKGVALFTGVLVVLSLWLAQVRMAVVVVALVAAGVYLLFWRWFGGGRRRDSQT